MASPATPLPCVKFALQIGESSSSPRSKSGFCDSHIHVAILSLVPIPRPGCAVSTELPLVASALPRGAYPRLARSLDAGRVRLRGPGTGHQLVGALGVQHPFSHRALSPTPWLRVRNSDQPVRSALRPRRCAGVCPGRLHPCRVDHRFGGRILELALRHPCDQVGIHRDPHATGRRGCAGRGGSDQSCAGVFRSIGRFIRCLRVSHRRARREEPAWCVPRHRGGRQPCLRDIPRPRLRLLVAPDVRRKWSQGLPSPWRSS